MAAAIEQNHDKDGIIWPMPVAPFHIIICPVNYGSDEKIRTAAEQLYKTLLDEGFEVMLDDRDERPGVMFKDADLIGIPIRLTIGKKALKTDSVELKLRWEQQSHFIPNEQIVQKLKEIIETHTKSDDHTRAG